MMTSLRLFSVKNLLLISAFLCGSLSLVSQAAEPAKINPTFNYIVDGQIVSGWGMQLGDPENWSTSVKDRVGKSATGKISVEPSDFKGHGDAIKMTWAPRKAVKGVAALYGSALDLSSFEHAGALVIDIKVNVIPDKDVTIGMDCGYPCRAELHVRKNIADLKKGEWTTLPIPLNCFSKEGVDLKKVNGPFVISTEGKLTVEITNVRLQKLAEGDKGCTKE